MRTRISFILVIGSSLKWSLIHSKCSIKNCAEDDFPESCHMSVSKLGALFSSAHVIQTAILWGLEKSKLREVDAHLKPQVILNSGSQFFSAALLLLLMVHFSVWYVLFLVLFHFCIWMHRIDATQHLVPDAFSSEWTFSFRLWEISLLKYKWIPLVLEAVSSLDIM